MKIYFVIFYLIVSTGTALANFAPPPVFKCSLISQDKIVMNLELEQIRSGKLIWRQGGVKREAIFIDPAFSHGSAIGAAIGWTDDTIRT